MKNDGKYYMDTKSYAFYCLIERHGGSISGYNQDIMSDLKIRSYAAFSEARKTLVNLGLIRYSQEGTRCGGSYTIIGKLK